MQCDQGGLGLFMPEKQVVLLFMKAPIRGQVKTRLAGLIGDEAALDLYKHFIFDILTTVEQTGYAVRVFFFPPEGKTALSDSLPHQYYLMPQHGEDLGAKMENAFARIFAEGFSSAVLIGTDIPDLPAAIIHEAFSSLKLNDAVIGSSTDGGYYLIGFKRKTFLPDVFRGMPWGTHRVLSGTLAVLKNALYRFHLVPRWNDIDTLEDLRAFFERNKDAGFSQSKTLQYLFATRLLEKEGPVDKSV